MEAMVARWPQAMTQVQVIAAEVKLDLVKTAVVRLDPVLPSLNLRPRY